jgi:hypothetical protein
MPEPWQKSSRRASSSCVEVRKDGKTVEVRQTENPDVVASFTLDDWAEFVARVKDGEFDHLGVA